MVRRIDGQPDAYKASELEAGAINNTIGMLLPSDNSNKIAIVEDLGYGDLPLRSENAYTLYKGKENPNNPSGYKGGWVCTKPLMSPKKSKI